MDLKLTETDKKILNSYGILAEGLSNFLGSAYEIVLHSLEDYDHSAIKVFNGFHTNRSVGAPITNLALTMLEEIKESQRQNNSYRSDVTYFVENSRGEPMKSTTIAVYGENERVIGLLCINFFLNTPFNDIIQSFSNSNQTSLVSNTFFDEQEEFVSDSRETINKRILKTQEEVLQDTTVSTSNKNKEIISRLYDNGVFNFKDAVTITADLLNISKNTVYLHLRSTKE
ncbi:helix-turn-helix transcriptional regulator [Fundicoccus culcitae]|uniref:PAS domain-containing protein n=1 Tax=Fundicoccus culcitae TaxID=2969821 RepID=A0ABY5P8R0_9LACT|nr:PAS domain-containing protein [Fundicoccus culcitae]UUX34755.1 PAS domain-containing protein [Fundicoccus culcitae]